MICATRDIILFNKRLDEEERRDMYIPVQISGVSVYDNRQSTKEGGFHSQSDDFKIRIPISADVQDGRTYLPETQYDALPDDDASGYWTIHTEDMIVICAADILDVNTSVFTSDSELLEPDAVETIADEVGFQKEVIHITSYADNTLRGSDRVKHWRIGGA